jgi:hypothetical protein
MFAAKAAPAIFGFDGFLVGASLLANAALDLTLWNVRGQGRSYKPRLR